MANIASYPSATPKGADLLVGSVTYDANDPTSPKGNPTRNFTVSSIATQVSAITLPYKVYVAELSNFGAGTTAPVATIFQNTLSGAITWTRNDVGVYIGTLADAFTSNKSHCITQSMIVSNPSIGANGVNGVTDTNEWPAQQISSFTSTNTIQLNHFVLAQSGAATKSDNIKIFIEIKVYS